MQVNLNFNINIDDRIAKFFKKILGKKRNVVIASMAIILSSVALYAATMDWTDFQPGDTLSANSLNTRFNSLRDESIPVGTIMAWHQNFKGKTPALNDHWKKCDGTKVQDSESPYVNERVPNLNQPKYSWNYKGSFLRGHTSSGAWEDDKFQGHLRSIHVATNGGSGNAADFTTSNNSARAFTARNNKSCNYQYKDSKGNFLGAYITHGSYGGPRPSKETRPVSMSVVWIIKIK